MDNHYIVDRPNGMVDDQQLCRHNVWLSTVVVYAG